VAQARLTREEKKAQTRERLLDAAQTVFARRGFLAASLDEIAEEAGLTKGAVYSNFESKEDLFQAVLDDRYNDRTMRIADLVDNTASFDVQAAEGARMLQDYFQEERIMTLLTLEFEIYAIRNPDFAPRSRAHSRELRHAVAELISQHTQDWGRLSLSPEELAIAFIALSNGMAILKLADPDGVPDDLLGKLYALLARPDAAPESSGDG
jgi:AcrR family transcriptional regulator